MRTKKEIQEEIDALKALKPVGIFKEKTKRSIELAIEELENGVDQTADEWNELTDEQRDLVLQVENWKEGTTDDKASEGWGSLVEEPKKKKGNR